MTQQRLDRIEDEFETVKQLLASAARYARSTHEGLDELTRKQNRTQVQLDRLGVRVDDLASSQDRTQVQLDQLSAKVNHFVEQAEDRIEQLEAIAVGLDRNFLEFQRTTTAALERMDRILDYLLRQQQGGS